MSTNVLATLPRRVALLNYPRGALLPRGWRDLTQQIALLASFSLAYEVIAAAMHGDRHIALTHARDIVHTERTLGLFHEDAIQRLTLHAPSLVIDIANWTYINSQFTVAYILLAWIYLRHNASFRTVRNAVLTIDALGLIGYVAYPTAPPRMLPNLGVVDTVHQTGLDQRSGLVARLADPYAAMPSLHTAYAVLLGGAAAVLVTRPVIKALWAAYPTLVVFSIIATGNHFFLDALAGILLAAIALTAQLALARIRKRRVQQTTKAAGSRPANSLPTRTRTTQPAPEIAQPLSLTSGPSGQRASVGASAT